MLSMANLTIKISSTAQQKKTATISHLHSGWHNFKVIILKTILNMVKLESPIGIGQQIFMSDSILSKQKSAITVIFPTVVRLVRAKVSIKSKQGKKPSCTA